MPVYGVSITIPQPYAAQLHTARERAGDPLAGLIPPHVTLLPPTEIAAESVDDVHAYLGEVAGRFTSFEMRLSGTGTFRPISPVVFAEVVRGADQCEELELAVRSGPLVRDTEFSYHPHVTIAHNIDDASLDTAYAQCADFEAEFIVTSFELFHQQSDGSWHPVRSYALTGSPPTKG